jgi:hypothetical protein
MVPLAEEMERLFLQTEHRVVAAFLVCKAEPSAPRARPPRAARPTDKPRALCLTVQRRSRARGFKASVHVCKRERDGSWTVRRGQRLKLLLRVDALGGGGGDGDGALLELAFAQRALTGGETRWAFAADSAAQRAEIAASVRSLCAAHEGRSPGGGAATPDSAEPDAAPARAAAAARRARRASPDRAGGPPAAVLDMDAAAGGGSDGEGEGGAARAARESGAVAALLDASLDAAAGAPSVGELRARLAAELAALEGASVHEALASGAAAAATSAELGDALALADELGDALGMLDAKLRLMREDVAAIEGRSNALETRYSNSRRLLAALEALTGALALAPGAEEALRAGELATGRLEGVVAAAEGLAARLAALEPAPGSGGAPGAVPRGVAGMAAVRARRRQLQGLATVFADRAAEYLARELGAVADAHLAAAAAAAGAERLRPAPHAGVHARAAELAPLLAAVAALRPEAAPPLRRRYAAAVNALLRRELAGAAKELARAAERGSGAHGAHGADAAVQQQQGVFIALLDAFVPLLALECQQCERLACAGAAPAEAEAVGAALLAGVDALLLGLAPEAARPARPEPALPMLAAVLGWRRALHGRAGAAPLDAVLRACERALRAAWEAGVVEAAGAVARAARASTAPGALPCVAAFEAAAARVEAAARGEARGREAPRCPGGRARSPSPFESLPQPEHAAHRRADAEDAVAAAAAGQKEAPASSATSLTYMSESLDAMTDLASDSARTPPLNRLRPSAGSAAGGSAAGTPGSVTGPAARGAGASAPAAAPPPPDPAAAAVRALADARHERVLGAVLAAIEAAAGADGVRQAPRVRLENYSHLAPALRRLAAGGAAGAPLARGAAAAAAAREAALEAFVEQQAAELRLGALLAAGEGLARGGDAAAAAAEARGEAAAAAAGLAKRLGAARARLRRALPGGAALDAAVWERLAARCGAAWEALAAAGVPVAPRAAELRAMFAAASTTGAQQ